MKQQPKSSSSESPLPRVLLLPLVAVVLCNVIGLDLATAYGKGPDGLAQQLKESAGLEKAIKTKGEDAASVQDVFDLLEELLDPSGFGDAKVGLLAGRELLNALPDPGVSKWGDVIEALDTEIVEALQTEGRAHRFGKAEDMSLRHDYIVLEMPHVEPKVVLRLTSVVKDHRQQKGKLSWIIVGASVVVLVVATYWVKSRS